VYERLRWIRRDVVLKPLGHFAYFGDGALLGGGLERPLVLLLPSVDLPLRKAVGMTEFVETDGFVIDGVDGRQRIDHLLSHSPPILRLPESIGFVVPNYGPFHPLHHVELGADNVLVLAGYHRRRNRHVRPLERLEYRVLANYVVRVSAVSPGGGRRITRSRSPHVTNNVSLECASWVSINVEPVRRTDVLFEKRFERVEIDESVEVRLVVFTHVLFTPIRP